MQTILIILAILAVGAGVYYFGFYKQGKINDRDGDFIPDEVEDAVEDVKKVAKTVKRRAKRVKEELGDVADAIKESILEQLVLEGVDDPGILKCVFMAGGPGSGKSFTAMEIFGIDKICFGE